MGMKRPVGKAQSATIGVITNQTAPLEWPLRVKMRKPHVEHNESAFTLIADLPGGHGLRLRWV